jgi:hypothetical protein
MKLVLQTLGAFVLLLGGAALLVVIGQGTGLQLAPNDAVSRADFLGIILSALAVMLTAVTIFLGVLALFGWVTFESRVKQSSEAFLDRRFSDEDPRYKQLVEDIKADVIRKTLEGDRPSYPNEDASPFSEDAE